LLSNARARYAQKVLKDVTSDELHRALAEQTLVSAGRAVYVEIDPVDFGSRQSDRPSSWLCYVADPQADDLIAELTLKSAVDHFNGIDPGGFLANVGKRLAVHVHEIETSDEASIILQGDDGQDVLYSPWQRNLLFVRAAFTYQQS
jgi:hypothetical protein